jgi:hypothetical protein
MMAEVIVKREKSGEPSLKKKRAWWGAMEKSNAPLDFDKSSTCLLVAFQYQYQFYIERYITTTCTNSSLSNRKAHVHPCRVHSPRPKHRGGFVNGLRLDQEKFRGGQVIILGIFEFSSSIRCHLGNCVLSRSEIGNLRLPTPEIQFYIPTNSFEII